MKNTLILSLVSFCLTTGATAFADPATPLHQMAKRPYAAVKHDKPDQPWEGASLTTAERPEAAAAAEQRKRAFRQQLNVQYMSKRPYTDPGTPE